MTDVMINQNTSVQGSDGDWTLTSDQMVFMLRHHNAMLAAYQTDDLDFLRALAQSEDYAAVFGTMSFDEAYDRYEFSSI